MDQLQRLFSVEKLTTVTYTEL